VSQKSRPAEQPAVKTTIVGGRPPGPGKGVGEVPRGIEILVKKASVDADFKRLLLEKRAEAAKEIALALEPAETMMLNAVPAAQLEAIIASTTVAPVSRAAFLGKAAAVMLAALGAGVGCNEPPPAPAGIPPDRVPTTKGIQGDRPPDRVPVTDGIRPDRPEDVKEMQEPAPPLPTPPKPKTETPTSTAPTPQPEQPMMPVAGAVPQPIPRTKPNGTPSVAKGVQPDKP